ncbi:MAG: 3'-5' exonuclease [Lachnospiraceae bacterium]|nr:3'-5' exonuclease [Lachnospiraceae bacterium]
MTDSYVAVDLETTGIAVKREKIIELAMVRVENGEIADTFHTLVNPHRQIPKRITELTGIDDDMVRSAPDVGDVIDRAVDFCKDLALLGHQVLFDYGFLLQAAVNRTLAFEKNGIDTLRLCRAFMPLEEKKNLTNACAYFGVPQDTAHRALSDAMAAHRLYQELKKCFGEKDAALFSEKKLLFKIKKEKAATKRQKQHLQDLIKYHRISVTVQIESLSGNEISRLIDRIIFTHGRIPEKEGTGIKFRNADKLN